MDFSATANPLSHASNIPWFDIFKVALDYILCAAKVSRMRINSKKKDSHTKSCDHPLPVAFSMYIVLKCLTESFLKLQQNSYENRSHEPTYIFAREN